ncbi:MAG: glutathione S-transferase family protein [Sphingomicrobium sp.]
MSGLVLHEDARSGNCYKIRLTAAHVGIELERRNYDIMKGETRTAEYLRDVNANGRIPVLQDGDRFLPESNAICFFLANGTNLIPDGHFDQADMLRWMFWEQYNHEPSIATLRFWIRFVGLDALADAQRMQITGKRENGLAALDLMDTHLDGRKFFVADQFSLDDISLFAYTQVADEADFDLEAYPHIIRWLERIMLLPKHVGLED